MQTPSIAVVGATGLVGTTILQILKERQFPLKNLYLLASQQSEGMNMSWNEQDYQVQSLDQFDFSRCQIAFFCVSRELAAQYAKIAADAGCIVIDKSYHFRNDPNVPLIIPEINAKKLTAMNNGGIIACPNCNTIPIAVAVKPIYDKAGITRMNISTYQSVSGTGKDAIHELTEQTRSHLAGSSYPPKVYPHPIAFNVLPHIDDFQDNGYTREEMKMVWEIKKLFDNQTIQINPTAVRVPVFYGHAASVHLETRDKITAKDALELLKKAPGVKLSGELTGYVTPSTQAAGNDDVHVGRIREDISHPQGLNLWVVTDNLRKGAALNAVQIAEYLLGKS